VQGKELSARGRAPPRGPRPRPRHPLSFPQHFRSAVFALARDADHAAALAATAGREGLGTVFRVRYEA